MTVLLTLTLLSQHPIPIEPDAMSRSWALGVPIDAPITTIDDTNTSGYETNYDDSTHAIGGHYATSDIWPIQMRGFTVADSELADYQAEFTVWEESYTYPQLPVLVVWVKDAPHYVISDAHEMHFYTFWLACPACYTYHSLSDDFGRQVREQIQDPRYTAYVVRRDLWPTRTLTYAELRGKDHIFKTPWQLRYKLLQLSPTTKAPSLSEVPAWVRVRLGDNERWIDRAARVLGDQTWLEFLVMNGYIPGDRTTADMQYNYALRMTMPWSERLRRETPPCEPEAGERGYGPGGRYTACAEALYNAEMQATQNERDWVDALVESYLGGE